MILTYLAEVFPHYCLFISISAIFRGKKGSKLDQSLGPSLFHKNSNPTKIFKIMFLFARLLPLVNISVILDPYFGGVKIQNPPKKGYFVDAESVSKTLKIFNLPTTNLILLKLTTIMYLPESVNRKTFRARNSVFWLNF